MAKHSPPDDASFALSLVRHLGAAVALVAVCAAAFWGVGQVRDDGSDLDIAAAPDDGAGSGTTDPATPAPGGTDPASATPPADEGTEPTEVATPLEDDTATATETEDPTEGSTEDVPAATVDIDPADISVQVLDATGEGGAAGERVADQLESDGFDVVATNQAVRVYDTTTVFYTPGNEDKAERIAAMYGYDEVAPEPGNLSHSVDVHVVVGLDA